MNQWKKLSCRDKRKSRTAMRLDHELKKYLNKDIVTD